MNVLARELPSRAAESGEFRSKALLQLAFTEALALLDGGKVQEALSQIGPYAEIAAESSAGAYVFGLIHFNAGNLRDALNWLDRALLLQPAFLDALAARAVVQQRLGQPHDALESFEAILKLRPNDVEALFSIGVVAQSLGRLAEAVAAYERALTLSPAHCGALTNRGALLERFGRLDEALACFDAIEAINPADNTNLFNRGSVLQKLGRHHEALAAYQEAARRGPPDADTELNRGNVLQKLGRLEEALEAYGLASQYRNGYPQALYNKGIALQALGRRNEALAAYDEALTLDPSYYEASCNRGNVLHELGRDEDALAACLYTLRIRPGFLPALANRANILLRLGRTEEAILSCDEVLGRNPAHSQCFGIRGAALQRCGRLDDALASLEDSLRLNPEAPEAWLNKGNVLQELGRHSDAVACYHRALRIKPGYAEALSGLGVALKELGRIDEALESFTEALKIKPGFPDARNNRAGALLLKGRLREGFADFESRWERSNALPNILHPNLPQWDGQELRGRKILVCDEQGLGDLIQFSRYLLCLAEAGAEVAFLCRKGMHRLLSTLPAPVHFLERPDEANDCDFQCALMSLPSGFRTGLDTIPARVPYLYPESGRVGKWAGRIGASGFKIGIAWQGNKFINLKRSIPLPAFAPVAAIPGTRLISLMKDQGSLSVDCRGGQFTVECPGSGFDAGRDSFVDCAAAMANCDLVIASDTSIAHLAGALGRPAFVALKKVPDWRWLLDREDCPWYPGMRLFRQTEYGDWDPVFTRIARAVEELVTQKACGAERTPEQKMAVTVPCSAGELIDKIAILEIKQARIASEDKVAHVRHELSLLRKLRAECCFDGNELAKFSAELKSVNSLLWDAENAIRAHEARGDFGAGFTALARQIYQFNDQRAALKRSINCLLNSEIIEEKSY